MCDDAAKREALEKNGEAHRAWHAAYRARNGDKQWAYCLARNFGLTVEQYNEMLISQGGVCAICRGKPRGRKTRLSVDHCHTTRKIRGLLCDHCNRAIGILGESPEVLARAADYLSGGEWLDMKEELDLRRYG
jgi:hypothetical protein